MGAIYVENYHISMKKLLFRKFIKDTIIFFIIITLVMSLIVWVIQAVGFLDFVTEDGHSFYVYFLYSLLTFPKIIHRMLPFLFFISLFYQIIQYEIRSELNIFWQNGINKITFVNIILSYSLIIFIFQIVLGSFLSPLSQNEARSYIRNSNIDYFPSLIKQGKFIDTISRLTIFVESIDKNGNYKNIFLKENIDGGDGSKSQIIYAKRGKLVDSSPSRFFELYDGRIISVSNKDITNFEFQKVDFDLLKYQSKTTTYPKIQETSSVDLFMCLYYDFKKQKNLFKAQYLRCEVGMITNIKQEFLKRFYQPIYIPLLALLCGLLFIKSKEDISFSKYRFILFILIFLIIVISEISLRYSTKSDSGLIFYIAFPVFCFFTTYLFLKNKFINKL